MKKILFTLFFVFSLTLSALSQERPKIFIAPMENSLNEFLTAAFIKEKVPVTVLTTDEGADYIVTGVSIKGEGKWYDTVFGTEKDRNQGSIKLIKVADKSLAWAGSAGDKRGFWDPVWAKTGQEKVAKRLAKSIKKEYFQKVLKLK